MTTLVAIVVGGVAMVSIALVGGVALVVADARLHAWIGRLVALAAGALLGGALFHLLPAAVEALDNRLAVWVWVAAGFAGFLLLEQVLHWHHHHGSPTTHRVEPVSWLLLIADGVHNLLGGLAVGGAFLVDLRMGVVAWLVAAAHEIPQELGDFGVLVRSGWSPRQALAANVVSALPFLAGGVIAWALSTTVDMAYLVALGAGNFLYIGAVDLVPEFKAPQDLGAALAHYAWFAAGLIALAAVRVFAHG